jgi:membrane-associated protease RseP (regulator of RpoE activity)
MREGSAHHAEANDNPPSSPMQAEPRRMADSVTPLVLFLSTCLTTTWAGALQLHPTISWFRFDEALPLLPDGLPFSGTLMAILISHEMGHYLIARKHRVRVTFPLFIPLPLGWIGTLGAIIGMPRHVRDRNALLDIGAAGPIAGLVIALPLLAYGLSLSPVGPIAPGGMVEGNSLAYLLLKVLVKGRILPGDGLDVFLHPVALAGWVGLLVTMINLLPIGQLDGGHVAYAFFGERHDAAVVWLHRALVPIGASVAIYVSIDLGGPQMGARTVIPALMAGAPWIVWWLLLSLMRRLSGGRYHPPVGSAPLTPGRRRLALVVLVIFLSIFTPIPLRVS